MTGLFVQFNLHSSCHEWRRWCRWTVTFCCFQCTAISTHWFRTNIYQWYRLPCFWPFYTVACKFQFFHRCIQHTGCNLKNSGDQFLAGFFYRFSCYICRTWRIRSRIVWRRIRICSEDFYIFHRTIQAFCRHLCKDRITSGTHICRCDHQSIESIIIHLNGCRSYIDTGDSGTLHSHCDSHTSDFAVSHIFVWIFIFPSDQLRSPFKATVKCTALRRLTVICRHNVAFSYHVLKTDLHRIHMKSLRHLIYRRFHRKDSLCCSISTICSCCHVICIDNIICKTVCFCRTI